MAVKGRTILRIFALTVFAAVLVWQHLNGTHGGHAGGAAGVPRTGTGTGTGTAAVSSPPAEKLPPPRRWQLGTLNLTSCELPHFLSGATTAAWCTEFDVAENPVHTEGRHIGLHLALIRSEAARPAADMVVMLAGGPGDGD